MNVIQSREVLQNRTQFFIYRLFCELYLSHVEGTNALDLVARMNHCGCLSLCASQNNVNEGSCIWNRRYFLKVIDNHGKVQREFIAFSVVHSV